MIVTPHSVITWTYNQSSINVSRILQQFTKCGPAPLIVKDTAYHRQFDASISKIIIMNRPRWKEIQTMSYKKEEKKWWKN